MGVENGEWQLNAYGVMRMFWTPQRYTVCTKSTGGGTLKWLPLSCVNFTSIIKTDWSEAVNTALTIVQVRDDTNLDYLGSRKDGDTGDVRFVWEEKLI